MKNTETEEKLSELEARNVQLETNLSLLAARNSQLEAGSFSSDDEIDLKELWNAIWAGKWLIIAITFAFSVVSIVFALSLPNEYKSTALLAPASTSNSSSLSKLAGQFGGLASLAGLNLEGGSDSKVVVAMEIMKTWGFVESFIRENGIEVEVFAVEGWERSSNKLIIDSNVYEQESGKWVRDFDPDKGEKPEPSSWELFEEFQDRVSINQDATTGLINLTVEYYSPNIAKEWVDKLVEKINLHMQIKDREEATKSITYLNRKIDETNLADMKSVFYQLIEEQTKTLMLAEVSDEYVFKTLSESKVAQEKSQPKRALISIAGFILGFIFSVFFVLIRKYKANSDIRKQ